MQSEWCALIIESPNNHLFIDFCNFEIEPSFFVSFYKRIKMNAAILFVYFITPHRNKNHIGL